MHTSIKMDYPCEPINIVPLNPLISKCQIKVCYVSDEPNRNRSVITKEVAKQIANSLPGSPIVGYFNELNGDYEEHNETITIKNGGTLTITDDTKPYGFVDLNAKCWFQKFLDDGVNEREYLVTEGYLWTGQYKEAQRIIDHGNNQSMELDNNYLDGYWTKDNNGEPKFFIINEAIISKLCILGENFEPCFEGSSITKVQFSLDESFTKELHSMMVELKELLNKGGTQMFTTYSVTVGDSLWNALYGYISEDMAIEGVFEEDTQKFAIIKDNDIYKRLNFSFDEENGFVPEGDLTVFENYVPAETPQFSAEDVAQYKQAKKDEEDKEDKSDEKKNEESSEDKDKEEDKADEDDKKKKDYSLEEIPEYVALNTQYSELNETYNTLKQSFDELQTNYSSLKTENDNLHTEIANLNKFKLDIERVQKKNMIDNQFYMLSDEDKKDVNEHIDTYSLDEIEAKLSVICVRNKVNFTLEDDTKEPTTYNLNGQLFQDEDTPAWVKAVLETAKTLN